MKKLEWYKRRVQFEEKNNTRKLTVRVKAYAERVKEIQERPKLKGNKLWMPSG